MKKTSGFALAIVFAVFLSIACVNTATAKNSLAVVDSRENSATYKASATTTSQASATTTGQSVGVQKLTEAKLKTCQNKEAAVRERNDALIKMAENMLIKFDSIAARVKTYYTDKVVPSGKKVSNYDALVADIATKKTVVRSGLDDATTDALAFNCTSDDPKGQLVQFRTRMQAVKQALKEYRTSIKDLIVAVRSVTGTTESGSGSTTNQ